MKLEVGMKIRTKNGYICELININDFREPCMKYGVEANYLRDVMFIGDEDIAKASHNIIDLIEFGDYVNGVLINYKDKEGVYHTAFDCEDEVHFTNPEDIKTILTKEQYEANAYEVKHENN